MLYVAALLFLLQCITSPLVYSALHLFAFPLLSFLLLPARALVRLLRTDTYSQEQRGRAALTQFPTAQSERLYFGLEAATLP